MSTIKDHISRLGRSSPVPIGTYEHVDSSDDDLATLFQQPVRYYSGLEK